MVQGVKNRSVKHDPNFMCNSVDKRVKIKYCK